MVDNYQNGRLPQIIFGDGQLNKLPEIIRSYGKNIALITGKASFSNSPWGKEVLKSLDKHQVFFKQFVVSREPTPGDIDEISRHFKIEMPHVVVAIGGGSVLDAGKAVSAMIGQQSSVKDFLEGVGTKEHPGTKIPFIACPTTAGTGSECTKNAVITEVGQEGFKKSLRHNNFVPDVAIVDPTTSLGLPPAQSAASGMDALTQLIESYLSDNASAFTDSLALPAIGYALRSLPRIMEEPTDLAARKGMSYASMISGITLANAGLGTVHGYASALGGFFDIPHGVVCGTLMGACLEKTFEKLKETGNIIGLKKMAAMGKLLSLDNNISDDSAANLLIEKINQWVVNFKIPPLRQYSITRNDFEKIIDITSNKNNPVKLNKDDLTEILEWRL